MKEVPLTRGYIAVVDDDDYAAVVASGPWHVRLSTRRAYAAHSISETASISLHRFITGWPTVDHINLDGLDNRRANLRPATRSQNGGNAELRNDNRTGFKGVILYPNGRWRAQISSVYLGMFTSAEEAARAYDTAALERWGEFARTNFPQEIAS